MKKRVWKKIGIGLLCLVLLGGCGMKGSRASAPKDDSKVAKEEFELFPEFKTKDVEGNEVTEAIFKEKDLTMVNFWGSTCGPCLDELDELQEISENLPETIGIVGILVDVPLGYEAGEERVKTALKEAGVEYSNLFPDEALTDFSDRVSLTPYTIFVDKEGHIVGDVVKGARIKKYIDEIEELVEGFHYQKKEEK